MRVMSATAQCTSGGRNSTGLVIARILRTVSIKCKERCSRSESTQCQVITYWNNSISDRQRRYAADQAPRKWPKNSQEGSDLLRFTVRSARIRPVLCILLQSVRWLLYQWLACLLLCMRLGPLQVRGSDRRCAYVSTLVDCHSLFTEHTNGKEQLRPGIDDSK